MAKAAAQIMAAAITLPEWVAAWLMPCCLGKSSLPTVAMVSAVREGPPSAPPVATTICAARIGPQPVHDEHRQRAAHDHQAGDAPASCAAARCGRSSAPAGVAISMPATSPADSTRPIRSGGHFSASDSQVDRNGPIPPPTSAMKKLMTGSPSAGRHHRWRSWDTPYPDVVIVAVLAGPLRRYQGMFRVRAITRAHSAAIR